MQSELPAFTTIFCHNSRLDLRLIRTIFKEFLYLHKCRLLPYMVSIADLGIVLVAPSC